IMAAHMNNLDATHGSASRSSGLVPPLEVSVVIPCLNEAKSIGLCVDKAVRALAESNLRGEVVVADNGSTDGSVEVAAGRRARVHARSLRPPGCSQHRNGIRAGDDYQSGTNRGAHHGDSHHTVARQTGPAAASAQLS